MNKPIQNIENGVVIDHIPAGKAMKCLELMHLKTNNMKLIGMHMNSNKMQLKDFIKIENYYPSGEETAIISLIAPNATISTIKKGKVESKKQVKPPQEITGVFKCINPKCVTNTERSVTPKFKVESVKPLSLRCFYCDKQMNEKELTEYHQQG